MTTSLSTSADGPLGPSAERLRGEALRFLRHFGLVAAGWSVLLAAAAPTVAHTGRLWMGIGVLVGWAVAARWVAPPRAWWAGWLVAATGAELLGPWAGTDGWSVTGGATMVVITGAALSGSAVPVIGTVAWLSGVAVVRSVVGEGWTLGDAVGTTLLFAFGGLAVAWLVGAARRALDERDRLQEALEAARTEAVRRAEREEAAARLHDTVLQQLTAVARADGLDQARAHATRAGNELRSFLRLPRTATTATLRSELERAVTVAAGDATLSVGGSGDVPVSPAIERLVAATAEAVRNAAEHGEGSPIRVFTEVDGGTARVWVTDQGPGFDRSAVPDDRLGVRRSIEERLANVGGEARLRSGADGTEWELAVPV